ncbi:MAG: hypothetical protein U1D33_02500, partial [bacterium]|nr:hypothetical protein [bacterium]
MEGVRALEEKQQVQTAKFLKKKDSFRFKRGDSGSALPDEIDSVCTMQSLSKMGEKKAEDAAPIRTSVGGLVANWRYNAEAQRQFNASKSQEVAGNAKYYSGSALDVGRVPVMRGRDVFRPDHTNIAVTRRGGTRTVTYAPPLHAFENNSLGSYQFSGTSGSSHQLRADISGQCRGAGCVVLILRGSANQPTEAHLRTSFTASSSLKEIRFDYSLYGGGHYSPAVFSVNVLGSSNERVATTIIGDDYQCPPNESRGYYSCSLSPRNIGLGELTPNQSYTIDFTFLTTNNPALHELSLDNIQFLDTQNREYGGSRQTTSETQNTYENVFTEFSTVQGVRVSDTLTAYFQNVNNWVIMLPFPGSALNVGVLSALPNDVQNPRHILSYNNLEVPMSSQDSGNKKNYAGSASLNILPTHNTFALTVTSQHQYTAQYPAAFTDTIAGVLDRRPPQVSASLKLPFKDFATTEVSVGVDFNATDDVALNSVGVTKRSGGTGVRIVDNAVAVSTVGGRSVRAVTALSAGAGGTIRIPQLDAATTSLDVFVTDWVASGSSFRAAFSAPLPVKVYDLANTHVVCDTYITTVGDPLRCRWSQASKPFNSIVLVQQADKSKTIRFRDFPTQHRGGEKPVELYYDQRTQIFAADKPGEYDLEGFFFDSTPTEPQLVRRSNKVARIVVEEGSPAKPTAVRVNEGFASIFPPRRFACPGSGVTRVKFFRKDSPQATNLLELGVMDIDEAMRRGFTDGHVVQNSKPVYYVKPMYGEEEGVLSLGDTTTLVTARPKVTLDAMPRPGKPTHLQIEWIASAGGGADPLIPSPQQRSGQRETLLVPQRPGSALAFKTGRDLLYKSKLLLPATPMQSAPLAADANLANRLLADEKGEMPELTDAGYAGLLDDHLHPIVEHGFLILGGDFTKPALAPEQLYSLVDLVDSFVVSSVVSFLPPNSPGGERCSAEGDFEGMRFVCESAYNALFVLLPTLSPSLSEALTKFWFDPQNNGGLLVSMAFKKWCDDNLDACIPNASSRNFSNLDQMPETARESYARALATQDAAEMAWRDRLYAANAANEEGRCLFQTECSYDLDWLPYFDAYFVQRYFQ